MRCMYLWRVYSAVREEIMQNVSEDVFCTDGSEGSENRVWRLFR